MIKLIKYVALLLGLFFLSLIYSSQTQAHAADYYVDNNGMDINNYGMNTSLSRAKILTPQNNDSYILNHRHLTYHIDTKNKYWKSVYTGAIKLWKKSSAITLTQVSNPHYADIVLNTKKFNSGENQDYLGLSCPADGTDGRASIEYTELYTAMLNLQYNKKEKINIAAHEIGHDLGLAHSPYKKSVMNPYTEYAPTKPDYNTVKSIYRNLPDNNPMGNLYHQASVKF